WMDIDRDPASIVADADGAIFVQRDNDFVAKACQSLVDGIIHNLEDHVMQTGPIIGVADVHSRPLTHGLQAFQHLDTAGIVGFVHATGSAYEQTNNCTTSTPIRGYAKYLVPRGTRCRVDQCLRHENPLQ